MRSTAVACWHAGWPRGRMRARGFARRTSTSRSCHLPAQHRPDRGSGATLLCIVHCVMEALLLLWHFMGMGLVVIV